MKPWLVRIVVGSLTAVILVTSGCGQITANDPESMEARRSRSHDPYAEFFKTQPVKQLERSGPKALNQGDEAIALITDGQQYYVPLQEVANRLGYQIEWDETEQVMGIGDTDPFIQLNMNSTQAIKEDSPVTLPNAPVKLSGAAHIPLTAFEVLFQNEIDYSVQSGKLMLHQSFSDAPPPEDLNTEEMTPQELDFADDPNDPAGSADEEVWSGIEGLSVDDADSAVSVLKNINMNSMLKTSRNYVGVKYKFGAKPYSSSNNRFDCSSYTQFVYGKYNVSLPRTARSQAKRGVSVSRKNLRKGDMLFFYVPGRFKKEKTIGHVGIYLGNRKMIHAAPDPKNGVQITNIDKAYWKRTFVTARRVAT